MDVNISSEFQQAQQYEQQGNLAQAKVAYESVLRQSPDHELSLYGLALIYAQSGDIKSAKSLFEKIARHSGSSNHKEEFKNSFLTCHSLNKNNGNHIKKTT